MASLYTWNQLWELGEEMNLRMPNLAAGPGTGGSGSIRDQHGALDALRTQRHFQETGLEVDTVHNETGHQAIFGHLVPDVIGVTPQREVRTVAEVGGKRGAGGDRIGD